MGHEGIEVSNVSVTDEAAAWHRRFAMSCNNRAWDLAAAPRAAAEEREMLDAAHASAWHWSQVGTEQNRMRATMLLAEVHALAGHGTPAMAYAREMRSYFLGRDTPDWELAFTHAIYAHAAHVAGDAEEHRAAYRMAVEALNAIADAADRAIVARTFELVPAPQR
jgi:hypothetical protein